MRSILLIILLVPLSAPAGDSFPISENPGFEPAVAALTDSSAVVVYRSVETVYFAIPGSVPETLLAPPGTDPGSAPHVATLSENGFVAAWLIDDSVGIRPVARIFTRDGVPTTDLLEVGGSGNASDISVTSGPGSGFVVAWSRFGPPDQEHVFVRTFDASGRPTMTELRVNEDENAYNIHPRVTTAPDGSFTVAWGTFTPLVSTSRARRHFGEGGSWENSWQLAENAVFPAVGAADDGKVLFTWVSTVGKQEVLSRRQGEPAIVIGGSGAGAQGMAMHPTGVAAVAWHEGGIGLSGQLRARILDSQGQPEGEVVPVADGVTGAGNSPGVAVSPAGRVVIVWVDQTTGRVHGRWLDSPIVPVAERSWGALKSLWR